MNPKIILASDLDNTLIYSYKKISKQSNKLCVECYEGKKLTFMTNKSIIFLRKLNQLINFIPITTRSLKQYNRIVWPSRITPKYALTTNGAILLINGLIDEQWYQESLNLISNYQEELEKTYNKLLSLNIFQKCRIVDNFFIFCSASNLPNISELVPELKQISTLNFCLSFKKIYFFPDPINKGSALRRLIKLFNPDFVFSSGDSYIDIPMIYSSNHSFFNHNNLYLTLADQRIKKSVYDQSLHFSDYFLVNILKYLK